MSEFREITPSFWASPQIDLADVRFRVESG